MNETWFSEIEPKLFTAFEFRMKKKFPGVYCTTAQENVTERKFPTVYFHELEQVEQGNDLVNETVNAVLSTIQVQVFSKDAQQNKAIMNEAVRLMKQFAFNITSMPIYTTNDDGTVSLSVCRCRRMIGYGDMDNLI